MKLTHLNPYRLQELRQSLHSVYDHSVYAEPVAFKPIDTFRILSYLVDIAHSLQIASPPPKNWRPQDLHLYKCFRPLTPFLTTSEEPQKKHFFKHINDNLRKDI